MHPRNPYAARRPDFAALAESDAAFKPFVRISEHSEPSINFNDPAALRALTAALLRKDFGLDVTLRDDRLCPTIANRLDYLLTCLGLPFPPPLRALDIGTGHVAIYALLLRALRPDAAVYGSEIDAESLEHARGVLKHNRIPPVPETIAEASEATATASASVLAPDSAAGGVTLLPACPNGGLLTHPILPLSFTLCNPPFFSSESEVATSRASKPVGTSGPTCSINEEITRGGEAAFISQMIEESAREPLRDRVAWFTSLVGRYSTLEAVVTLVKRTTGNYAVVRLQQARTVRWVVVWSFGWDRLPDEMTRPRHLDPSTSFARLLPLPNTFSADVRKDVAELEKAVNDVLEGVGLPLLQQNTAPALVENSVNSDDKAEAVGNAISDDTGATSSTAAPSPAPSSTLASIQLAPTTITWSRAARRAAARSSDANTEKTGAETAVANTATPSTPEPLFRATLRIATTTNAGSGPDSDSEPLSLALDWEWGSDRAVVDAFWKFLVSKAGLIRKRERDDGEEEEEEEGRSRSRSETFDARGRGRGRNYHNGGGRGRGRGRGFGNVGGRGASQDAGWAPRSQT